MENKQLEALSEIRGLMERSSTYLSLSGLSGVLMGIIALSGAGLYCFVHGVSLVDDEYYKVLLRIDGTVNISRVYDMLSFALPVLILSLLVAAVMTYGKSQKLQQQFWGATSKRLIINLMIPMFTGGLFLLALISKGLVFLLAPVSLIFYGLALFHTSKYTISDLRFLGIAEIILGILSSWWTGIGLITWILGFGIAHILYGIYIYQRYEKHIK